MEETQSCGRYVFQRATLLAALASPGSLRKTEPLTATLLSADGRCSKVMDGSVPMPVCPARRWVTGFRGGSANGVISDCISGWHAGGHVNTSMRSSSGCGSWVMRYGNCGRHYMYLLDSPAGICSVTLIKAPLCERDGRDLCALASRQGHSVCDRIRMRITQTEKLMYFGGILGTVLIIALIIYFVRRV
jgi:hypothetical protein